MSRSSKSAGETAMAHARAWVNQRHPGALLLEAGARLSRFPDKTRPGEWITHTVREDLHGLFDMEVKPTQPGELVDLIQVTTIGKRTGGELDLSLVRARQAKVGNFARTTLHGARPTWLGGLYVVGWVQKKHLRIWLWSWEQQSATRFGGWKEQEPDPAKLPKRARNADAPPALALAGTNPFD